MNQTKKDDNYSTLEDRLFATKTEIIKTPVYKDIQCSVYEYEIVRVDDKEEEIKVRDKSENNLARTELIQRYPLKFIKEHPIEAVKSVSPLIALSGVATASYALIHYASKFMEYCFSK